MLKWKSGSKDISQRGYYPLDCKAMCYLLLHLQNNRGKDSNVFWEQNTKDILLRDPEDGDRVSGSLKTRNNERGNTLVPFYPFPPFCT